MPCTSELAQFPTPAMAILIVGIFLTLKLLTKWGLEKRRGRFQVASFGALPEEDCSFYQELLSMVFH
jgi:hypothetical protein